MWINLDSCISMMNQIQLRTCTVYNLHINFSLVEQVVNAARMTPVKNTVISSNNVAVIDIKKQGGHDAPNRAGITTFTLPEEDLLENKLQNVALGTTEDKDNTVLMVLAIFYNLLLKIFYIVLKIIMK